MLCLPGSKVAQRCAWQDATRLPLLRLDFGVLVGFTNRDPGFGFSLGATYVITR